MFRMSHEGKLADGQSSSSLPACDVTPPGPGSQESPWIGLLSVVSRRALSFLQRYLPGRTGTPYLGHTQVPSRGLKSFIDEETDFLLQLNDIMPLQQHRAPQVSLSYLCSDHEGATGLLEPTAGRAVSWPTTDSLRDLRFQCAEELDHNLCRREQTGSLSPIRTFLNHVWLSPMSSQEVQPSGWVDCEAMGPPAVSDGSKSRTWWGSLWGGEESLGGELLSDMSRAEEGTMTAWLCPQQQLFKTTTMIVQSSSGGGWIRGERAGLTDHKDEPFNNGGLQTVQDRVWSTPDQLNRIRKHLSGSEDPAPDQDNGYSSLEEEHLLVVKALSAEQDAISTDIISTKMEEGWSTAGQGEEEGTVEPSAPQCQNKAIAFIMGCPYSDDSSQAESSDDDDDDDDDDGFDSEGSSHLSDSSDEEDDESSDSEVDSEAERIWSSLAKSLDPYNPRNFTASLHTSLPKTIPSAPSPPSNQSSPTSSPDLTPVSVSLPLSDQDIWEDSTSASEVDEAENLRLWESFSGSSDSYSLNNFQAPIKTQGSVQSGPRTWTNKAPQTPHCSSHHSPAPPPEFMMGAEPMTSSKTVSCRSIKKVRFREQVEEFLVSCGEEDEDRKGPWEELARDRCRFLRRCQEVEQSIAYCLEPEHRRLVYRRHAVLWVQDY